MNEQVNYHAKYVLLFHEVGLLASVLAAAARRVHVLLHYLLIGNDGHFV